MKMTYKTLMRKVDDGLADIHAWELDGEHVDVTLYRNTGDRGRRETIEVTNMPKDHERRGSMDEKAVAKELVRLAKVLTAKSQTLGDFLDDDDLAEALEYELGRKIYGSSDTNGNEIFFYEAETQKGYPVVVSFLVNPSNQPTKSGVVKIGLFMEGRDAIDPEDETLGTLADGIQSFDNTDKIKDVANTLAMAVAKVLRRW